MIWLVSICLMASMVALVFHFWREVSRETENYPTEWWKRWLVRGLLAPLVVWALMNVGRMPFMPPLTHLIAYLRAKGFHGTAFMAQFSLAGLVIVAFWGALTMGWFVTSLFKKARNMDDLVIASFVWSPVLLLLSWPFYWLFGWSGFAFSFLFWISPLTHYLVSIAEVKPPPPTYSSAIAKMKFGKYADAEKAIIAQLERCETDFDGWMMLADLYASHFHDIAEAEKTICGLCDEPTTTPSQMSIALHKLADWQLHLRSDPNSARRVLEEICRRIPGTHLDRMARHRINQLPQSVRELEQQHQPKTVIMPAWVEELETARLPEEISRDAAAAQANQLVELLNKDPNDVNAREKLARALARPLGKFDLALEQLDLLLDIPGQIPTRRAEWLALKASWLIEHQGECEAAQKALEQLIHDFPQSQQAFAAQRRLSLMRVKPVSAKSFGEPEQEETDSNE